MVMIRPKGKAQKIAKAVLKGKGVDVKGTSKMEKTKVNGPYLQH